MIITQWNRNPKGEIIYSAVIQGSTAGLKDLLADKQMSDLDLSDMMHTYSTLSIVDSWGGLTAFPNPNSIGNSRTYWTNPLTGLEYTKPFALGTGYVYANIDYAERFVDEAYNQDYGKMKVQNLRPQVYAAEYLRRILKNVGYTFEVQGNPENIEKFNRLIVPSTSADMFVQKTGVQVQHSKGIAQTMTVTNTNAGMYHIANPLLKYPDEKKDVMPLCFKTYPIINNDLMTGTINKPYPWQDTFNGVTNSNLNLRWNNVFRITKDMKTSVQVNLNHSVTNLNTSGAVQYYTFQLVKRTGTFENENDSTSYDDWEVIGEVRKSVNYIAPTNGVYTPQIQNVQLIAEGVELFRMEEIMVRLVVDYDSWVAVSIPSDAGFIRIAKDTFSTMVSTARIGDKIIPQAPSDLTQFDFLRSLLLMMNMYCYTTKDNNKHLILKCYDDFYAMASPAYLTSTALNYTDKIDYSKNIEAKSNINLPKKYTLSFAEDSDFLNEKYKSLHNEVYGTLKFNDSYGTADEKKIEIKFAPTPPTRIDGVDRIMNFFTAEEVSLAGKKKMQVKPRILIYSGVFACSNYAMYDEIYPSTSVHWQPQLVTNTRWYALASTYWFRNNEAIQNSPLNVNGTAKQPVPKDDLMFAKPKSFFFNVDTNYTNLIKNGFQDHYVNQISELTNGNVFTLTCQARLDSFIIANLDLQQPIFIDMGAQGYSYFKILSVEYGGQNSTSKLQLQKIV